MKISRRDLKLMLLCTQMKIKSLEHMVESNHFPVGIGRSKESHEEQLEELRGVVERVKTEMEQIDIELY